tara:strand:- start:121 stop:258 length:138 start_codon:yes stop_codon:yes gene_type:complete
MLPEYVWHASTDVKDGVVVEICGSYIKYASACVISYFWPYGDDTK